jgi:hypothetical protein
MRKEKQAYIILVNERGEKKGKFVMMMMKA